MVWNINQVNNKDTKTKPTSFWWLYRNFEHISDLFLVFLLLTSQVNACWIITSSMLSNNNSKQETLCVVTIARICSILASLGKFKNFRRPIYKPVEHLWYNFHCKNSEPLSIFSKKLHRRCSFGFSIRLCFLRLFKRFISLKYLTL